jgi:hypothetical protein
MTAIDRSSPGAQKNDMKLFRACFVALTTASFGFILLAL